MSPKSTRRIPKYRLYRPKNLAVVRIDQHDHYLGKHGSPESYERYHRLIAKWLSGTDHRPAVKHSVDKGAISVNQLILPPREVCAWHRAERAKRRKTPMTPSQRKRRPKRSPKRVPGERYNTIAYDHAVSRACTRAGIPNWAPNRLRHNAGTRIRSEFGVEMARIILGHASAVTTEIYAEADREKAHRIMGEIG